MDLEDIKNILDVKSVLNEIELQPSVEIKTQINEEMTEENIEIKVQNKSEPKNDKNASKDETNDVFSYTKSGLFTSETHKIEIKNLPKHIGYDVSVVCFQLKG